MHRAAAAQLPPVDHRAPRSRSGNRRRATDLGVVTAVALAPIAATASPAAAQDFSYTSACSVTTKPTGELEAVTRTFRARIPITRAGKRWNLGGYDYWYRFSKATRWGAQSDEEVTITRGRIAGPSPWHSPDDHTSEVMWARERRWKGNTSAGATVVRMRAWFDIPRQNDPECSVATPRF